MIEVDALRKTFGDVVAVDQVSFRADDGNITGLLGPNGAGKTTTLRILAGLVSADAGTARVDGLDVREDPRGVQSRLGILPDARGLYPRLTARENVSYYGELQGLRGPELDRAVDELTDRLGLHAIAGRRVAGFSHGERAKVAIARAIVHRPRNVVLDEPTNGLDVMSTRVMRTLIRELKDEGRCVVFSSHVMQEVSALCDEIVVIAGGRVVAHGTVDDIRAHAGEESLEDAFVALTGGGGSVEL